MTSPRQAIEVDNNQANEPQNNEALLSRLANLRSRFVDSLSVADKARVFDLSTRMVPELDAWAARYPLIRRVRIWPLSLSVAAAAPFSTVEALVSTAKVSLWVFTLDDVFDEELIEVNELMGLAENYRAIALGAKDVPNDDRLGKPLWEVRSDLARYPLFRLIGRDWGEALCGTIDGMIREHDWRLGYELKGNAALPSYEEYVTNGLYSIGGPPHVWAAFITTDDSSSPQHLDHLRRMEHLASTCVRLANDLQSYEKEIAEGNINALVIISKGLEERGVPKLEALRAAETRVRGDIAKGLDRLGELQANAVTDTGLPEAVAADIARFVCEFYTQHDYHTFTSERS